MQGLIYGIWKNDKAKRKAIWEEVMKETLDFFERMTELGYEDRIGQQDMSYDIIESIRDNQDIIVEASVGIGKSYAYLIPLMYYYKITKKPFNGISQKNLQMRDHTCGVLCGARVEELPVILEFTSFQDKIKLNGDIWR